MPVVVLFIAIVVHLLQQQDANMSELRLTLLIAFPSCLLRSLYQSQLGPIVLIFVPSAPSDRFPFRVGHSLGRLRSSISHCTRATGSWALVSSSSSSAPTVRLANSSPTQIVGFTNSTLPV